MDNSQAEQFRSMVTVLHQAFQRKEPDRELLRLWWVKLAKYDLSDISKAMDKWVDTQTRMATINELLELCKPKVNIYSRLPSPVSIEANKRHADELVEQVNKMTKPITDHKAWARKIIADPKGRSDIAIRFAKEALRVEAE